MHGANRLGANSLIDIIVFGRRAAESISELCKPNHSLDDLKDDEGEESIEKVDNLLHKNGNTTM